MSKLTTQELDRLKKYIEAIINIKVSQPIKTIIFIVIYQLNRYLFSYKLTSDNNQKVIPYIYEYPLIKNNKLLCKKVSLSAPLILNTYLNEEIKNGDPDFHKINITQSPKTNKQKEKAKELVNDFLKSFFDYLLEQVDNKYEQISLINNFYEKAKLCSVKKNKLEKGNFYCHTHTNKALKDVNIGSYYNSHFIGQLVESIFDNDPNLFYYYHYRKPGSNTEKDNLRYSIDPTPALDIKVILQIIKDYSKVWKRPVMALINESLKDEDNIKPPPRPKPSFSTDVLYVAIKKNNKDNRDD